MDACPQRYVHNLNFFFVDRFILFRHCSNGNLVCRVINFIYELSMIDSYLHKFITDSNMILYINFFQSTNTAFPIAFAPKKIQLEIDTIVSDAYNSQT